MSKRGQNLRIALKREGDLEALYIAGAINFKLSEQADTEETTTKDSTNNAKEYETTKTGWSGSGQCRLVKDAEDIAAIGGWDIRRLVGKTVEVEFNETAGEKNRETTAKHVKGLAILTSWETTAQNGELTNADFAFQGTGELVEAGPVIGGPSEIILLPTATAKSAAFPASDGSAISKSTDADWLTLSGSGNNITFTPTAYAHASSGADPRVALVTITTANGGKKVVAVKQPMAAS